MRRYTDPLANRIDADQIENHWVEGSACTCAGIASAPLDPDDLPDGTEIARERKLGDGVYRFVLREE